MHKIVIDLYITLVLPLLVIAALLLWDSVQLYRGKNKLGGRQLLAFAVIPVAIVFVFFLSGDLRRVVSVDGWPSGRESME